MYPGTPGYRPKPPSQGTAETLALIAWVLQLLISLFWLWVGTLFLLGGAFFFFVLGGAIVLLFGVLLILLPILMLYVGYAYSYSRIRKGDFSGARGPTLLLGILGIPFGFLIVGILYLIAYSKTGDAETESRSMGGWPGTPGGTPPTYNYGTAYGTMPSAGTPPLSGGVAYAPAAPAAMAGNCPRCGRPATFIPQYGRSYCYSCAQYL